MKIRLPDIGARYCEYLTACGFVEEPDADTLEWVQDLPDEERYLSAGYNTSSRQRAYVRLLLGLRKERVHLHVDVASREAFRERPETTHRRRQIEAALRRFEGVTIRVGIDANFRVPLSDIGEAGSLIHALAFSPRADELGIKLTGAELEFQESPIRKLSWNSRQDSLWSTISLHRVSEHVDEGYLERVLVNSEAIFETLCLGKEKPHAS